MYNVDSLFCASTSLNSAFFCIGYCIIQSCYQLHVKSYMQPSIYLTIVFLNQRQSKTILVCRLRDFLYNVSVFFHVGETKISENEINVRTENVHRTGVRNKATFPSVWTCSNIHTWLCILDFCYDVQPTNIL